MNTLRKALTLAVGTASLACMGSVLASPLGLYGAVIDKTSPACLQVGDAISCSAPLLNYLEGNDPNATIAQGGYVLPSAQGQLSSYIVIAAGGGAQGNDDIDPSPGQVEDGFKTTDTNPEDFMATGKADGSSMTIGNMNDPDNNELPASWDNPGTWDVGVNWLIDALTIEGIRRELMIGFDYNQPQNADDASLDYWALITLRGWDDEGNPLQDINFEIGTFANAVSGTGFFDMPSSGDFATVFGVTCVAGDGTVTPKIGGQCEPGETRIVNAQATNATTIFAFLPELNENLEMYAAMGYDVISSRVLLGCFGGEPGGSFRPGIGYLADGGATTNCETGGFPDIFLLAGAPMTTTHEVPAPGTLVLLGGALLAGALLRRRLTM